MSMTAISRITDLGEGICPLHRSPVPYTTTFITGASTVFSNNLAVTVITSVGDQSCGHTSQANTGSSTVFAENLAVHRIADTGLGQGDDIYSAITGSSNVFNDGA
jgi:hypothetical protein